jgi:hypothetical protein
MEKLGPSLKTCIIFLTFKFFIIVKDTFNVS